MMKLRLVLVLLIFYTIATSFSVANAQTRGTIRCGDIVEGEVIAGQSQIVERPYSSDITVDDYALEIQAGTLINLTVQPLGGTFNASFVLVDSGGNDMLIVSEALDGEGELLSNFPLGSSNQILRIMGVRPGQVLASGSSSSHFYGDNLTTDNDAGNYFGAYEIRIGCTLRDGTVIEVGETSQANPIPPTAVFSGVGFPGLTPVDFENILKLPLIIGTPMTGALTPTGSEIFGFTFDANSNDKLDLNVTRLTGNLNLGVVILSADNKVVFYGGLITSESLATRLTLPTAGQYTIGVFRVDLLPPDAPEATAFQVAGTLNP